jgi:hypothetical protein
MNLKNQPPVYVPDEHRAEIEKLSKAALMDMVWDYAMQFAGVTDYVFDVEEGKAIAEFRSRREIILDLRQRQPELEREAKNQALAILAKANKEAERDHPLPRCMHGSALVDGSGEALEPPCGCRISSEMLED